MGFRATATVRQLLGGRTAVRAREVECFGSRHDALWERTANELVCATVRDASYLNWKYVNRPGQSFRRLELIDGEAVRGVAVWMFREPDGVYNYRRAFLVDLVAPQSDPQLLRAVIRAAVAEVADEADALLCLHVGAGLTAALRECGFFVRDPERFLLADPGAFTDEERKLLLTEGSWFVTQGDSDIDRP
jgi:hypothetical protein